MKKPHEHTHLMLVSVFEILASPPTIKPTNRINNTI